MRLGGSAATHQARLLGDKGQVRLVSDSLLLRDGQQRCVLLIANRRGGSRRRREVGNGARSHLQSYADSGIAIGGRGLSWHVAVAQDAKAAEVLLPEGVQG